MLPVGFRESETVRGNGLEQVQAKLVVWYSVRIGVLPMRLLSMMVRVNRLAHHPRWRVVRSLGFDERMLILSHQCAPRQF